MKTTSLYIVRAFSIFLLWVGLMFVGYLLPPFHYELEKTLIACLGVILIWFAITLLRRTDLHWLPQSGLKRLYFLTVYGTLFTWFITCSVWSESIRGFFAPPPSLLTVRVREYLNIYSLPPIVGMGADLLASLWLEKRYWLYSRALGFGILLYGLASVLSEIHAWG